MDNLTGTIVNSQTSSETSTLENEGASSARHRIIVIDDEPGNRTLCRQALEPDGIVCDEAADGIQGLKSTTWGNYDLVLLDIDLPEMQGTEVLRQLRMNPPCPNLKIIMMSGQAREDEMARMMRAGADDYLTVLSGLTK